MEEHANARYVGFLVIIILYFNFTITVYPENPFGEGLWMTSLIGMLSRNMVLMMDHQLSQ